MTRLPARAGERIDRSRTVRFSFDGKPVEALEGDTIGSALYAAGQRTFSRSFKYHRRRGLMCCAGQCPNCMVQVEDAPGVRACTEPVREGMSVVHMNATPSLDFDVMRATDLVGTPFTPPGFYYKTFIRPRRLWPLYEKVLRSAAGLGKLPRSRREREWRTEYRRRHADVLVVGGGAAGLAAATAAAELGADVVLADEGPEPGGRLLAEGGHEYARELTERASSAGVELLTSAPALGTFDGLVPVWQGDTLHQVRARRQVYATGAIEQPLLFSGNDLPGVMLSGGARRLLSLYSVQPGARAAVATVSDRGLEAALALQDAGVELACVADLRSGAATPPALELARRGVEIQHGATVLEARGRSHLQGVVIGAPGAGEGSNGDRAVACDLLVVSGGSAPATSLLTQAGARTGYDTERGLFALTELPEDLLAAGEVTGQGELDTAELSGAVAGAEAAHSLGLGDAASRERAAEGMDRLEGRRPGPDESAVPPARTGERKGKCFACLCEDVTAKDIHLSVEEGYDSIELSKRYTTTTMGPCQGRMCQLPAIRLMAEETGQSLEEVGTTTARPPWQAVPMGALAGRPFEPAKRSSIHGRHRELGANVLWAGDWRRAYDYGDARGEALAVHESAGLIDVSTLGKLIVRGPDAGEFLDRLYPNRFSNLKPGRIRYGVIASDAGRIMDDGTICRLDDDSYYVTTTSSGAGAVYDWFSWWLADWRLGVHLTDVTQGSGRRQPGRAQGAGDHVGGHRSRLLERGLHLPRRQAGGGRGSARADAAHRLRGRGGLRDPLRRRARRARLGRAAGGRRPARPAPLRPRAPASAAPAEDARADRTGHRFGVHPLQRGDALDRQARQGPGLHRPLGPRARRRGAARDRAGGLHAARWPGAHRGRGGAHRGRRRAGGPGDQRPPLAPARRRDRDGLGAVRAGRGGDRHHHLRRGPPAAGPGGHQALLRPRGRGAPLVSLGFLSPGPEALARSPMEREALAAGARIERQGGWNVAVGFGGGAPERERCRSSVGFADHSHLGKIELQAGAAELAELTHGATLELGRAVRADGAWWCPYTPERALVLCETEAAADLLERLSDAAPTASVIDVTAVYAALTLVGPLARELFARFTALDLRDAVTPVRGFRPGSVARVPGAILREGEERWLMLFGAALGRYVWTVVADAAGHLGGGPVGTEALDPVEEPLEATPSA